MPAGFHFKYYPASVAHALSLGQCDVAIETAHLDSVECQALQACGILPAEVCGFVSQTIQNCLLHRLNLVAAHANVAATEAGTGAIKLLDQILISVSDPEWIPGRAAHVGLRAVRLLLDVEKSELSAVSDVCALFESDRLQGIQVADTDIVAEWIRSSIIGRALLAYAGSFIQEHTAEVAAGRLMTLAKDFADSFLRHDIVQDCPEEAGDNRREIELYVGVVLGSFEEKCK